MLGAITLRRCALQPRQSRCRKVAATLRGILAYFRPSKKVALGSRPLFPLLSYITANFREHRVLINDAFCRQSAASVLSLTRAKIVCLHMPDVAHGGPDVVDVNEGEGQAEQCQPQKETQNEGDSDMFCADEVAAGEYVRLVDAPKGQFFDVSANPQYEARGFLWGVAFKLQPRPALAAAPV